MYITGDNQPEVAPFHDISSVPSFAGSTPQSLLEPLGGRLRYAIRDYHYLSQSEIGRAKRISQQLFPLSGPGGQNLAEERLNRDCLSGALLSGSGDGRCQVVT